MFVTEKLCSLFDIIMVLPNMQNEITYRQEEQAMYVYTPSAEGTCIVLMIHWIQTHLPALFIYKFLVNPVETTHLCCTPTHSLEHALRFALRSSLNRHNCNGRIDCVIVTKCYLVRTVSASQMGSCRQEFYFHWNAVTWLTNCTNAYSYELFRLRGR